MVLRVFRWGPFSGSDLLAAPGSLEAFQRLWLADIQASSCWSQPALHRHIIQPAIPSSSRSKMPILGKWEKGKVFLSPILPFFCCCLIVDFLFFFFFFGISPGKLCLKKVSENESEWFSFHIWLLQCEALLKRRMTRIKNKMSPTSKADLWDEGSYYSQHCENYWGNCDSNNTRYQWDDWLWLILCWWGEHKENTTEKKQPNQTKHLMLHLCRPEGWWIHHKLHFTGSQTGISCKRKKWFCFWFPPLPPAKLFWEEKKKKQKQKSFLTQAVAVCTHAHQQTSQV